ncbi:helix-turn-helix domain-containing protein [Candidatus Avelusimicrobium caledoniensis]|uniref:helix-turn-helix domain-containing protein n=1 Tax=Candidatus Avelusimicrobium caledoniensis TaxID=3416220 RepID=UPI003D112522
MFDLGTFSFKDFDDQDIYAPDMFESLIQDFGIHYHVYNKKPPKDGLYYPQVIFKRYMGKYPQRETTKLIVKCNIPKLLHGSNIMEVTDNDLSKVCTVLSQRLDVMGITVSPTDIQCATLDGFEYGKNILTGRIPVPFILSEIYRADPIHSKMDIQRVAYQNGGEKLVFYSSGYEIVFYDKTYELQNEIKHKRCKLPEHLQKEVKAGRLNVLRMEMRFHNRKGWIAVLKKYNPSIRFSDFNDLFSQQMSKQVLRDYWHAISDPARKAPINVFDPAFELWRIAKGSKKTLKPQALLAMLGTNYLKRGAGHHEAVRSLKRLGFSNPALFLRQNTGAVSRINWRFDVWRFIDYSLNRFVCLTPNKWMHLKKRTSAVWFKRYEAFLTVKEVAQQLNVSTKVIRNEIHRKRLQAYDIGHRLRISRTGLAAYLNRCIK